jgi:hypothetical protein
MPSHAPLCGINRPHARYWSRTNRIDLILELSPVTSDTVAVPPPTRSPEPKVTRYIVIRNDQHDGSPHPGKIFIVAGNRLAAAHPPGKAAITFRDHSASRPPQPSLARPPAGPGRGDCDPARRIFRLGRQQPRPSAIRLASRPASRPASPDPNGRRDPAHPDFRAGRPRPEGSGGSAPALPRWPESLRRDRPAQVGNQLARDLPASEPRLFR